MLHKPTTVPLCKMQLISKMVDLQASLVSTTQYEVMPVYLRCLCQRSPHISLDNNTFSIEQ